jgi:hypothetical protein
VGQRASLAFCTGCTFSANTNFALSSNSGAIVSALDSVITGARGLASSSFAYVDIDCISAATGAPCSLNATTLAGQAITSTTAFYGAGAFTGRFQAFDRGHIDLLSAQQTAITGNNILDTDSTLSVVPDALESQIAGTTVISNFSRALLLSAATVAGSVICENAGDAWKDPGVSVTGSITGCTHVP